jgi:hypothetical protein
MKNMHVELSRGRRLNHSITQSLRLAVLAALLASACATPTPAPEPTPALPPEPPISEMYTRLSEQGGYFDSDNLISNETSYLHALDALRVRQISGGAYIGVGPDQSFSYIAEIKPQLAFIIDIRRDNMLQHLMFRSLFQRSRNRMEFLSGLIGADVPGDITRWTGKPIEEIVAVLDSAMRSPATFAKWSAQVIEDAKATGITLSEADISTIQGFHREFHQLGLQIRYTSKNRPPRLSYPTMEQLILETDRAGAKSSYLSSEERWRTIRDMQVANRIIFVTGDLSGATALRNIGNYLRERNIPVSVFYTSNVEQYLFQFGTFPDFAANTSTLPFAPNGVIIRSYFNRAGGHPFAVAGHISVQLVQTASDFVRRTNAGGYTSYFELVNY